MNKVVTQSLRVNKSTTTQKGIEQVLTILKAARDVFERAGYSKLSLREVAAEAGVTYGAVQYYFKNKNALVEAMLLHVFEEIQEFIDGVVLKGESDSPIEQFEIIMKFVIEYVESVAFQRMFFELSALASRHKFAAATMEKLFTNARKAIRRLLREISPKLTEIELGIRAALILELLMGSMFIVGKSRPRPQVLRSLEQRTLQAMIAIAVQKR